MPFTLSLRSFLSLLCLSAAVLLGGCAAEMHHREGMQLVERADYKNGLRELQQAAELKPHDVVYRKDWLENREAAITKLLSKANKALADGDDSGAVTHYQAILEFDRENSRAKSGLDQLEKTKRANEELTQARDAFKHGDLVLAQQWLARAQENAPGLAEAKALKREIDTLQAKEILVTPSLSAIYKKPINLEFRDASVKMVFDALSRTTGINFIFDREVKGDQRTTVFLRQTTLDDAIDVILSTNQLDKKILNASSVLIYPNTPSKLKEYQDLVVKAFYLANVEAKQAANLLKTVLKIKEVFIDDKYNMLVIRENPETIALADKLIALHDLDEPEVMLEVEVLEVNRSRLLNLGVQFTNQFTIAPLGGGSSSGTVGTGTTGTSSPTLSLNDVRRLNSDLLGITLPSATINLQKVDGDANLLANPRIRVRDREKAKILIGDKVPVVTTTSTPNGFVAENIQYLDVGLKLEVEPDIHLRDEIGLKIALEVSSLVSTVKTNSGSLAYQIGTRNFNSALRLKDGETQILGGLISDEDRSSANRVPLLGDLPLLGRLFSSQNDNRQKTEIILSITPHLIRNIQRKDPAAESFWSGTESTLRLKPLQLRALDANSVKPQSTGAKIGVPVTSPAPATPVSAANTSNLKLNWNGPAQAKVGEVLVLELNLNSVDTLRALPLQIAYNPAEFDIVDVQEGDFFNKGSKGNFSQVVDKSSGRISIGSSSGDAAGTKGDGRLLKISVRPLVASPEAEISVIGVTPIGSSQPVEKPLLPVSHKIAVITP